MPIYRRRHVKSSPDSWEMTEVLIITNEPAHIEASPVTTTIVREGLTLAASLLAAITMRRVLPAIGRRLISTRRERLQAPPRYLLPPPSQDK